MEDNEEGCVGSDSGDEDADGMLLPPELCPLVEGEAAPAAAALLHGILFI